MKIGVNPIEPYLVVFDLIILYNMFEDVISMPAGRPLKFQSPEMLQSLIDDYFDKCEKTNKPMTFAGLALAIGVDRWTLYNYENRDEYFHTIKNARDRVQAYVEEQMFIRGNAGVIFYAKNYGYTDRQEIAYTEQPLPTVIIDDTNEDD